MNSKIYQRLNNQIEISKENPEDVYKRVKEIFYFPQPIPIDTINKFWGVDSRILKHDETVQRQSFDQAYKNFWSFVDFNVMFHNSNEESFQGEELYKGSSKSFNNFNNKSQNGSKNLNSVSNSNFSGKSNLSYQEARRKANELIQK